VNLKTNVQHPISQPPRFLDPLTAQSVHPLDYQRVTLIFALIGEGQESTESTLGDVVTFEGGIAVIEQTCN
jgi:hypothetical protein